MIKRQRVDWKEHPIEVMASIDFLAGAAWRKDATRWDPIDALDLDKLRAGDFLTFAAGLLAKKKLAILTFDEGSDEEIFAVVPEARAKGPRIAPKPIATSKAAPLAGETKKLLAELDAKIVRAQTVDGGYLREFEILYVLRVVLAAGHLDAARRLLDLAVTNTLENLDEMQFRQHGPHIDGELLGAALLAGRGGEMVRAWAHQFSLGERSKTGLFRAFLGRDLPGTWKRGETTELDRLLAASKTTFDRVLEKHLAASWSTWSRSMKGSRACLLGTGLGVRVGAKLAVKDELERYVARALLPAPPEPKRPVLPTKLPRAPKLPRKLGPARDASRPQAAIAAQASELATWVTESLAHAKKEKSGMYLRAVPETACDVATLLYAAGAATDDVRAWLGLAVDLDIARCAHPAIEDALGWLDALREVAGAAMLLDRGPLLAAAWRKGRLPQGDSEGVLTALLAWLEDTRSPSAVASKRAVPKALGRALRERDATSLLAFVRTPRALPHPNQQGPWPGPASAFVSAMARKMSAPPAAIAAASMEELVGRVMPAAPSFVWPKPRTTQSLGDIRGVAVSTERRVAAGGEAVRLASDCLLLARCVWALGAPNDELHAWLSRAVDFAKKVPFNDDSVEYVGAARLVGRLRELGAMKPRKDATPPEIALTTVLADYAKGGKMRALDPKVLAKRTFFRPYAEAAVAARAGDTKAMSVALGRVPWRERREWTGADRRKRPPHWSFFTMGLAADHGFDALPKTARPQVERDVITGAVP